VGLSFSAGRENGYQGVVESGESLRGLQTICSKEGGIVVMHSKTRGEGKQEENPPFLNAQRDA